MAESNNCSSHDERHNQIQAVYTKLALQPEQEFAWGKGKTNARSLGYALAWLDALPDSVWESAAAVGNPFALGPLQPGEVVVDIGCGAGADLCIAASLIGKGGQAIGIDLTPAMVAKARDNAQRAGLDNITVYEADISDLLLSDACADRVISNGAINLAADKMRVFQEIYRILRPSGRLQFADMARLPTQAAEASCDSWADCVAGTLTPARYIELLENAGFKLVEQVAWTGYRTSATTEGATFRAVKP